jgi:glycosyltransferase involved in cell wall biosynthesis
MKTLGGTIFFHNPEKLDYCWREAIACLKALCDKVVILDAGSTDGTAEMVGSYHDEKTTVICLDNARWNAIAGREKLSHFTNQAASFLDTDWHINLQADEVIHEDSFPYIREAVQRDNEAYLCSRINLWGSSQHALNVEQHRKPVSTEITRLAKLGYLSYDDAESINAPAVADYVERIRIYHLGFVRNKYVHCEKVRSMQEDIFLFPEMDKKVQAMNGVFDAWQHFSKSDIIPIIEPLPKFVQDWARERDLVNQFL